MFKFAEQPISVGKVYGQSFSFYKDVFSKVWYWVLINIVIVSVAQFIVSWYMPVGQVPVDQVASMQLPPSQMLTFIALNFVVFVISVYFVGLVMHKMYVLGGGTTDTNSFQVVTRKWFLLVAVQLLVLLVLLLGMAAFILPAIVLAIFLAFCIPAILFEGKGVWGAIGHSFQLVVGNWWRTFIALIPGGVILFCNAALQLLLAKYAQNGFAILGVVALFFIITAALLYAFILVQYNDLKLRKQLKTES